MISYDICSREILLRELLCYPGLLPAHDILLGKDFAFVPDYENFENLRNHRLWSLIKICSSMTFFKK